jgi:hypothetical protein
MAKYPQGKFEFVVYNRQIGIVEASEHYLEHDLHARDLVHRAG